MSLLLTLNIFTHCSGVSIVNFEQINSGCEACCCKILLLENVNSNNNNNNNNSNNNNNLEEEVRNLGEKVRDILPALEADEEIGNLEEEEVAIIEEIAEVLERTQKYRLPTLRNVPKKKLLEEAAKVLIS